MAFEIEKKYRLTEIQREQVLRNLSECGAQFVSEDFEENVLFSGGILNLKPCILRLRTLENQDANRAVLTYKESLFAEGGAEDAGIKRRIEHETEIEDAAAMRLILQSLGYKPSLVYEKRRRTWDWGETEIVVDELPFGFYMEIEGTERAIEAAENALKIAALEPENEPYPSLTMQYGTPNGEIIEARFGEKKVAF